MSNKTNWQVEYLRITVFPDDNEKISISDLWDQNIGEEPDNINVQKGKISTREVEYKNGRIVLIKFEQPDRIEWRYLARQPEQDNSIFPIISNFEVALSDFKPLVLDWLNSADMFQVTRIAFGAVLLNPVETTEDGYNHLSTYLRFLDTTNLSDFQYRLNRRFPSKTIDEMLINHLRQWSVVNLHSLNVALNPSISIQLQSTTPASATRLELDINSSPDFGKVIPREKLSNLFRELIELGIQLSEDGEKSNDSK